MKRFKRKIRIFQYRSIREARNYLEIYTDKEDFKHLIYELIEAILIVGSVFFIMKYLIFYIFGSFLW